MPAVVGQVLNVSAQRLADAKASVNEQRQESDSASASIRAGSRQQAAQLVE